MWQQYPMATILIIDDSASMRNMITATLVASGHTVTDAADGQAGLNKAKTTQFDAIISDINMPIMNGIELTKQIRSLPNYRYTPILLLTTESANDKKLEGKNAGATGWLVKPFNPEKLIATVSRVLAWNYQHLTPVDVTKLKIKASISLAKLKTSD